MYTFIYPWFASFSTKKKPFTDRSCAISWRTLFRQADRQLAKSWNGKNAEATLEMTRF